ncbi:hypothetical protein [Glaciimonas immobilis]|uniref:Uncharacterized protein n=1 Tax=Glaciimonas immobilis TaxID=728004 RepID=A0A840RR54_9BURK|nr:hypothetical protein [Glaciimonas immobilis]KAF3999539.1 hypothetical protein HAV38_06420 [Glaciimonas immobilis]MBB5199081.1 hypothetical protein [Glaciimonas immobilis]
MLSSISSGGNTPSSNLRKLSIQDLIDNTFNVIDPLTVKKDTDIAASLKQVAESGSDIKQQYIKGIKEKLSEVACADKEYIKNDICICSDFLNGIGDTKLSLKESLIQQSVNAIKIGLPTFTMANLFITDETSHDRESVNFNRLLPEVGLAAQNYGPLGRKILSEGLKHVLQGDKKEERYDKLVTVIFDEEPSNDAVKTSTSDYYQSHWAKFRNTLDELYDPTKLV